MEREALLRRIAERLGRSRGAPPSVKPRHALARGETAAPAELAERFATELAAIGGKALLVRGPGAVRNALGAELAELGARRVLSWSRREFAGWGLDWLWNERGARAYGDRGLSDAASLRAALLEADVGVTGAEAALAATGTLVISAAATRPRALSLLPSVHIALLRAAAIVPDMPAWLERQAGQRGHELPSAIHFVSGPSRTSDIENDLTIGVHGPAAVIVIVDLEAP